MMLVAADAELAAEEDGLQQAGTLAADCTLLCPATILNLLTTDVTGDGSSSAGGEALLQHPATQLYLTAQMCEVVTGLVERRTFPVKLRRGFAIPAGARSSGSASDVGGGRGRCGCRGGSCRRGSSRSCLLGVKQLTTC